MGDNVAETMGKVKRDLGSEAVILQTRQFREGGFLGFFGKPKVEITAAIEERPAGRKTQPQTQTHTQTQPAGRDLADEINIRPDSWQDLELGISTRNPNSQDSSALQLELKQMRHMLELMNKQMEGLGEEKTIWPQTLRPWADFLRQRGMSESLGRRLLRQVQQTLPEEQWGNREPVLAALQENVLKLCTNTGSIRPGNGSSRPTVVALIGPTGVGKTTTIGKLAAGFSIVDKRRVALITADTYRVAAVEQLKTFGEIIGVDVEVAMTPSGLRDALLKHMDKELVFIDTAGRSPHHELHMSELRAFLDKAKPDFTLLVMSATTQLSDQLQVYKRFQDLASHIMFTKLDETESAGSLLSVLEQTKLPVAYVTNGQNVPDDIEIATPKRLAYYILGEEKPYA